MRRVRQGLTTALGVVLIVCGVIGASLALAYLLLNVGEGVEQRPIVLCENALSLVAKVGLFSAGIALLARSRLAFVFLLGIAVLSTGDSVLVFGWLMPPVPAGLSEAGRAGRVFGRMAGLIGPPAFYLAMLGYLMLPRSRAEFAREEDVLVEAV